MKCVNRMKHFSKQFQKFSFQSMAQKKVIQHKLVQPTTYTIQKGKEINLARYLYGNQPYKIKDKYDVIIVGAGHNGLVCANYLAKAGKSVLILEKRHVVGGCAVTEELVEGYKFSRCSYVLALFRKIIIDELFGDKFFKKVKLFKRDPNSFTPTKEVGQYLKMPKNKELRNIELAKFSTKDIKGLDDFNAFLTRMVNIIDPLLDLPPLTLDFKQKSNLKVLKHLYSKRHDLLDFYHFLTASAEYYLDKYLETDLLKGTLATDAAIGAITSPKSAGSAYVLLHHVMGNLDAAGSWYFVEGGNGAISNFLADEAVEKGVTIALNSPVKRLKIDQYNKVLEGVTLETGEEVRGDYIITNCDMNNTYFKLMSENQRVSVLPEETIKAFENIDYSSPVFKINLAVNKIPEFTCLSHLYEKGNIKEYEEKVASTHLTGTVHINSESINQIHDAYVDAMKGKISTTPIIEMTIPSVLDKSLTPQGSGHHVIGIFAQYAPDKLNTGIWDDMRKRDFANRVYANIDKVAPGFSKSIMFDDLLSPLDLEHEFSITGGNIFHGAMNLSSIFFCRPVLGHSSYKHSIKNLYSCSSAMHPGGGVMGAPGRNCALTILNKF
jgi:phytoene dehydrogenase-like protein